MSYSRTFDSFSEYISCIHPSTKTAIALSFVGCFLFSLISFCALKIALIVFFLFWSFIFLFFGDDVC